jgi:hypothetical protein
MWLTPTFHSMKALNPPRSASSIAMRYCNFKEELVAGVPCRTSKSASNLQYKSSSVNRDRVSSKLNRKKIDSSQFTVWNGVVGKQAHFKLDRETCTVKFLNEVMLFSWLLGSVHLITLNHRSVPFFVLLQTPHLPENLMPFGTFSQIGRFQNFWMHYRICGARGVACDILLWIPCQRTVSNLLVCPPSAQVSPSAGQYDCAKWCGSQLLRDRYDSVFAKPLLQGIL